MSNSPKWRKASNLNQSELPCSVKSWLLNEDSLTSQLIKKSGGDFSVNVLRQEWTYSYISEEKILSLLPKQECLIREVLLHCHNEPWIYARTVMPKSSLVDELEYLRNFDNKPLGHVLFNTPGIKREAFEVAKLKNTDLPHYVNKSILESSNKKTNDENVFHWGRRSKFTAYNKNLLVNEIFLPNFRP